MAMNAITLACCSKAAVRAIGQTGRKSGISARKFAVALCALGALAIAPVAAAQQARAETSLTLAQAERNAAELQRGMSSEEVRKLLGKPKRTGLKDDGAPSATSRGALRWTYVWNGGSGPGTLNVDFVSDAPEQWHVRGWEWSNY
jgi:hypothetical protein